MTSVTFDWDGGGIKEDVFETSVNRDLKPPPRHSISLALEVTGERRGHFWEEQQTKLSEHMQTEKMAWYITHR